MKTSLESSKRVIHNIRLRRGMFRWSAARLAEEAGVSRGMVSRIERGQREPSMDMLDKIAEALRCNPSLLLDVPVSHTADCRAQAHGQCNCFYDEYMQPMRDMEREAKEAENGR